MERNKNGTVKKGVVLNPKGRPKGTPNKSTVELKEAIKTILDSEIGKIQKHLNQLEPKERLEIIIKLLPYILPKTSQIEHTAIIEEKKEPTFDYSKLTYEQLDQLENLLRIGDGGLDSIDEVE